MESIDKYINQVICADSRDILKQLPNKCVDVCLTDPPYGVELGKNSKAEYDSIKDTPEVIVPIVNEVLKECLRIANIVAFTPGSRNMWFYPQPDHVGAFYYPAGNGMNDWGFTCWQPIFFYGKDPFLAKSLGGRPDSFSSSEPAEKNGHPCPKPIGQWSWLLKRVSFEGDIVLDPFNGSGTTCIAAMKFGRKYIGIDISEDYCKITRNRIEREKQIKRGQIF